MKSFLLVFLIAGGCTTLFLPLVSRLGRRLGAVDDTRDPPVPRIGGLAIWLGVVCSLLLVGVVFTPTALTLLASSRSLGAVAVAATVVFILGAVDDARPLSAWVKLPIQIAAAGLAYFMGVRILLVSGFGGALTLSPAISVVVTVLWLVGISNAFNLLDGADGVAAGSAFFAATAIFIVSVSLGNPAIGLVTAALAGSLLGFLPHNLPPARIFLGDSGSLLAGFLLAGLAVEGSTKGPTMVAIAVPLVAFAVPVFDTGLTILRRLMRGKPLFERDDDHLHHRLQKAGFKPMQVVGVIYMASAGFAFVAMLFINETVRTYAVALVIIGIAVWLMVRYLKLHEINELARLAKRGMAKPRAIAMNVQLRQASERLESTASIEDLCKALAILFRGSEFDGVALSLSKRGDQGAERKFRLEGDSFVEGLPERKADEWEVVCPFQGGDWTGELRLRRRLARKSLLMDLNLLLEVVQPSLATAVERIR
ncbi:MAG: MraY family glycosyltransferase [Gemmatimonadetes bacterium]|nr:MraY family glycosyltransferase [Gemmatimonadota bacterium]